MSQTGPSHGSRFAVAGKSVLVTGASSGIGREVAIDFGRGGARLLLVGRDVSRLSEVADTVDGAGGTAVPIEADIATDEGRAAIVRASESELGALDALVHSAGVYRRIPFTDMTPELFDFHLDSNLRAPYLLTHACLPLMRDGASVVFLSSSAAGAGIPNTSAYAASKAALEAVTRVLAVELAPRGIRVNAVAPGFTATPMNERLRADPAIVEKTLAATPMGRLSDPDDVSPAVLFLSSDAARFVCGAVLPVTGGYPNAFGAPRADGARRQSVPAQQEPTGGDVPPHD